MRKAFTLVELLAANLLAALLMLAVLTVIGALGRTQSALARQQVRDARPDAVIQLLRWDLRHARSIVQEPNGVALEGYGAMDGGNLSADHLPVKVEYALRPAGGVNWLVRYQKPAGSAGGGPAWAGLVCPGVQAFELKQVKPERGPTSQPATGRVRLRVLWDDPQRTPVDELIVTE